MRIFQEEYLEKVLNLEFKIQKWFWQALVRKFKVKKFGTNFNKKK